MRVNAGIQVWIVMGGEVERERVRGRHVVIELLHAGFPISCCSQEILAVLKITTPKNFVGALDHVLTSLYYATLFSEQTRRQSLQYVVLFSYEKKETTR